MDTLILLALALPAAAQDLPEPTGAVEMDPDQLEVHEKERFAITYTVGPGGMQVGDAIRLEDPHFHGMRWAKWGYLTLDTGDCSPLAELVGDGSGGSLLVDASDLSVELEVSRSTDSPGLHSDAWTDIVLAEGELAEGEAITVSVGHPFLGEDCGLQTSPRTMERVPWGLFERLDGEDGDWEEVQGPLFDFVTTREAVTLLVSLPSQAVVGEEVTVLVAAMDDLGNPTPGYGGAVSLEGGSHVFTEADAGVWETTLTADEEGVIRLTAAGSGGLVGRSNPMVVSEEAPDLHVFWGDMHTHHGHGYRDEDGTLIDLNHRYGRDVVGMQVGCESLKAYPHELDSETLWPELQESCAQETEEGRYVAFLCYEWMGNENSPGEEGHHNVYYDDCEGPHAPNSTTGLTGGDDALWSFMLEAEAETGSWSVSVPHAPVYTGFNWRDRDDEMRPLAEIFSEWGDSSSMNGRGSSVYDGLAEGNRMGVIASSDNHDGWIGNRWAYKTAEGGLAAFAATDLSRAGIFEAMEARSTYGTTGIRPVLRFSAEDGAEVPMGAEYIAEAPTFSWRYVAEGLASRVELLAVDTEGGEEVQLLRSWAPGADDASGSFTHEDWGGGSVAVWLHVEEDDGEEAWSSPIWLSSDCGDERVVDLAGRCEEGGDSGDSGPVDSGDSGPVDSGDSGPPDSGEGHKDRPCGCGGEGGAAGLLLLPLLGWRRRRV